MDSSSFEWLPHSFSRSPFWRMLRASYRLRHGLAADARIDDPGVEDAHTLVAAVEQYDPDRVPEAVWAAYTVWVDDREPGWLLEAQLLTPRPLTEIAAACALPLPVVEAYARLFFDVRERLRHRDWVLSRVVPARLLNAPAGPPLGCVWRYFGYFGGGPVLDAVVAATTGRPFPAGEERLRAELAVAALTARTAGEVCATIKQREQVRRLDQAAGRTTGDPLPPSLTAFWTLLARTSSAQPGAGTRRGCGGTRQTPAPPSSLWKSALVPGAADGQAGPPARQGQTDAKPVAPTPSAPERTTAQPAASADPPAEPRERRLLAG